MAGPGGSVAAEASAAVHLSKSAANAILRLGSLDVGYGDRERWSERLPDPVPTVGASEFRKAVPPRYRPISDICLLSQLRTPGIPTTAVFSTAIGPVTLATFPPGRYLVHIEATDKLAQKTTSAQAGFGVLP